MPAKKTIKQKEAAKTQRKVRKPGKVGASDSVAIPEAYLTEDHLPYFNAIVKHLQDNDAIQAIDSYVISQCAYWLWIYRKAAEDITEFGTIQKFPRTGAIQISPYVTNLSNAQSNLEKCFKLLGMTPEAREKLASFQVEAKQDDDPIAKLLSGN